MLYSMQVSQRAMKRLLKNLPCLAILGALLLATGCKNLSNEDNMSERPWNSPRSWEHGVPTGLMPNR